MKPKQHFQTNLLRSYSAFMLAIILFATIYWVVQLYSEQRGAVTSQLALLARQGSAGMDAALARTKPVLYMHLENQLVEQVLAEQPAAGADPLNLYYLEQGALQQNPDLISITFVGLDKSVYASHTDTTPQEVLDRSLGLASGRNGIPFIDRPEHQVINGERQYVLPIYKELISTKTGRSVGYVLVNLDFAGLCRGMDAADMLADGYYTMVLSGEDAAYLTNVNHRLFETFTGGFSLELLQHVQGESGGHYYYQDHSVSIYGIRNEQANCTILKFCSVRQFTSEIGGRIFLFVAISLLCFALMLVVAKTVSRRLSSNIRLLNRALGSSDVFNLRHIDTAGIRRDEIADLIHTFNHMIDSLNLSIEKEYAATIQAQQMQIKMLNYQINPHFLYNCLNLIGSLGILHEVPIITKFSRMLGEMYHYSIGSGDEVCIRDELSHIQDYLEIQKVRFPELCEVEYHIDEALLPLSCMKFILQPVVENSFSHGFSTAGRKGRYHIVIHIRQADGIIEFVVRDDGRGIPPERLEAIRENLYSNRNTIVSGQDSIGLWNIHRRIETYYGKPFGMQIESGAGAYTQVTLRFPAEKEQTP